LREQALHCLHTIGTVGADDAGWSALEPSGDVQTLRCFCAVHHPAAHMRHCSAKLVKRQPGNGHSAITDTSEDEPAGQFDLLFGWPCNLCERRSFQKVSCQNDLLHVAVADESRRAQMKPKPDGAPCEFRFPGGKRAKERHISGTANIA